MSTLRTLFGDDFSRSAFQVVDDELQLVGRFGRISELGDGQYDAWFVGRDLAPLTKQKIAAIRRAMPQEWHLQELDGEAIAQGTGRDFVLAAAFLANVKPKRRVSAATVANLAATRRRNHLSACRVVADG